MSGPGGVVMKGVPLHPILVTPWLWIRRIGLLFLFWKIELLASVEMRGHGYPPSAHRSQQAAIKGNFSHRPQLPSHFQIRERSEWKALIDSQRHKLIHFDSSNSILHQCDGGRLGDHSPWAGIDPSSSPAPRSTPQHPCSHCIVRNWNFSCRVAWGMSAEGRGAGWGGVLLGITLISQGFQHLRVILF